MTHFDATAGTPYYVGVVSTLASTLDAVGGTSATIFADLGKGNYGSVGVIPGTDLASVLSTVSIRLNATAISDINAAIGNTSNSGEFSIGGTLIPSAAVPEPGALTLLGIAVASVLGYGYSRRGRSAA